MEAETVDCDPEEVIIASSSNAVTVYHAKSGKPIKTYKNFAIASKCLTLLGEEYFIGAAEGVPQIKTWTISDAKASKQVVSPCGIVSALAATSCGKYCVAAIKQEIRIWDVESGEMLTSFSRHYQAVTCLRFTSDDSMFLSGGNDGNVLVWMLCTVTSVNCDPDRVKPHYSWNNHSKEVTDIFIGSMGVYSRVATSSADMTCKIYELDTGLLLTTICMDVLLTCVVMDPLDIYVILGSHKGSIYKINLYYEQPRELHSSGMEKEEVQAHLDQVNSLSISISGHKLLTASSDKTCKIWDLGSLSCLFKLPTDDILTNAFFALYPATLLTKEEPIFIARQFDRALISASERIKKPYKRVKLQHHPLSLMHVGSADKLYHPDLLSGTYSRAKQESTVEQSSSENLFQEAFKGETVDEVRGVNSQLYSYMMRKVFDSMEAFPVVHLPTEES